jgi:hypothetical protein
MLRVLFEKGVILVSQRLDLFGKLPIGFPKGRADAS